MQSLEMLIMTYRLLTARGVKEVIHGGLHPNNINKNNGIKIPEARIPMIKKHNERLVQQQTAGETTWNQTSQKTRTHWNNGDRNTPFAFDCSETNGNA